MFHDTKVYDGVTVFGKFSVSHIMPDFLHQMYWFALTAFQDSFVGLCC